MGEEANPGNGGLAGEAPATLSLLQVLVAHLIVAGGALVLTALHAPEAALPRVLMVALAVACLLVSMTKLFPPAALRPHEWTSLGVVLLLAVLLGAAGFGVGIP